MEGSQKARNWGTLLYPESCAENWEEIISGWHMPVLVSPLHDKDLNKDGSPKKPHYHVLMMFDGPTTRNHVKKLVDTLKGAGVQEIISKSGDARYFCHLDNPEKAQYAVEDVRAFGCRYEDIIVRGEDDRKEGLIDVVGDMLDFCEKSGCDSFYRLVQEARKKGHRDWLKALLYNSAAQSMVYRCLRSMEYERSRVQPVPAGRA